MKILLLADLECPYLWDYYRPGRLSEYNLILSAGDLSANYLSFLVTMGRAPVLYIHGNHDVNYEQQPPEGCDCVEDQLYIYNGVRILGLGGCPVYNKMPHQYSEKQMRKRIRKLRWKIKKAGGIDIVLTHAPVAGYGDGDDYAHRGFECFLDLIDTYKPKYFIHGHVHINYGTGNPREYERNGTKIINAYERYVIEI